MSKLQTLIDTVHECRMEGVLIEHPAVGGVGFVCATNAQANVVQRFARSLGIRTTILGMTVHAYGKEIER